jgi:hypothetical protein
MATSPNWQEKVAPKNEPSTSEPTELNPRGYDYLTREVGRES